MLLAESTKPITLPYPSEDKITKFTIGRDANSWAVWGHNFQIADLRIWEAVIPEQKVRDVYANAGNLSSI